MLSRPVFIHRPVQELPKEGPVQPKLDDQLLVSDSFFFFTTTSHNLPAVLCVVQNWYVLTGSPQPVRRLIIVVHTCSHRWSSEHSAARFSRLPWKGKVVSERIYVVSFLLIAFIATRGAWKAQETTPADECKRLYVEKLIEVSSGFD